VSLDTASAALAEHDGRPPSNPKALVTIVVDDQTDVDGTVELVVEGDPHASIEAVAKSLGLAVAQPTGKIASTIRPAASEAFISSEPTQPGGGK
jgi:hypothetical protein